MRYLYFLYILILLFPSCGVHENIAEIMEPIPVHIAQVSEPKELVLSGSYRNFSSFKKHGLMGRIGYSPKQSLGLMGSFYNQWRFTNNDIDKNNLQAAELGIGTYIKSSSIWFNNRVFHLYGGLAHYQAKDYKQMFTVGGNFEGIDKFDANSMQYWIQLGGTVGTSPEERIQLKLNSTMRYSWIKTYKLDHHSTFRMIEEELPAFNLLQYDISLQISWKNFALLGQFGYRALLL